MLNVKTMFPIQRQLRTTKVEPGVERLTKDVVEQHQSPSGYEVMKLRQLGK